MKIIPRIGALLVFAHSAALADVSLYFVGQENQTSLVQTNGQWVRVEQGAEPQNYMLYDKTKAELKIVNAAEKQYHLIDKTRIEQASKKITSAKANMIDNFSKLPPEQQARLRPLLDKMQAAENRKLTTQKLGQKSIAGVQCTEHQVLDDGLPTKKICAATAKALGITTVDYNSLVGMLNMLADINNKMGAGMMAGTASPEEIGGIPVLTAENDASQPTQLTKISKSPIAAERFTVPANFTHAQPPN